MPPLSIPDPELLFVAPTNASDDTTPPSVNLKYNIYYHTAVNADGTLQSAPAGLCGLSFFGEVAGLVDTTPPVPDTTGSSIHLLSKADYDPNNVGMPPPADILKGSHYKMTFDSYLDQLKTHLVDPDHPQTSKTAGINYSRLFLFQLYDVPYLPFDKVNGKYDLKTVSETFLKRLEEFIEKARARGIVVCISLFSHHMLRADDDYWKGSPFNAKLNNTAKDSSTDGGFIAEDDGLPEFFEIEEVPKGVGYDGSWSTPKRLFWIQRNFVQTIIARTKPYWNVIYELFNEPSLLEMSEDDRSTVVAWFGHLSDWMNSSLAENGKRTRLIALTSIDDLQADLLAELATPVEQPAIDIFGLHGTQWATDAGKQEFCNYGHTADPTAIKTDIESAITAFQAYHLALIFDSDALYWAQKNPEEYVKACQDKTASFNYRWRDDVLNEIVNKKATDIDGVCHKVGGDGFENRGNWVLGLSQRVELIQNGQVAAAQAMTVFPRPPAGQPTNLKATVKITKDGPQLHLAFDSAAAPFEGYVAYFGPTDVALGTGTALFPKLKYFGPDTTQGFDVSFTPTDDHPIVSVAVAARNGLVPSTPSNIAQLLRPAPPAGTPTNLKLEVPPNTAQPTTGKALLRLTFNPAEGPHDGYVAFFGPTMDSVGAGTEDFKPLVYFTVDNETAPQLDLEFTPTAHGHSVYVAVAACNGLVAGPRSNISFISSYSAKLDLANTNLPVGYNKSIPTREDFRGDQYFMTFVNTGVTRWLGTAKELDSYGRVTTERTLGVYMPIREMASGLSLLFIPINTANGKAETEPVSPGDSVTIHLNEMKVPYGFEEYFAPPYAVVLPYSRRELSFETGMGMIEVRTSYVPNLPGAPPSTVIASQYASYGHFGKTYRCLTEDGTCPDTVPPDQQHPIRVKVDDPKRRSMKSVLNSDALNTTGNPFPLNIKRDFDQFLTSLTTTQTAATNTIIRSFVELVNPGSDPAAPPAAPERRVRVLREGSNDKPKVEVFAVLLDPIDLYYAGPHVDPKGGLYDVPGSGGTRAGSLERFEGRYTVTSARSNTPIKAGETINWAVRPGCDGGQRKQLIITNNSQLGPVTVQVMTVEIWEDIKKEDDTLRQVYNDNEKIEAAAPTTVYVELGQSLGDAAKHHLCVATLHADKPAIINYDIVLKADDSGHFKRMLEIHVEGNYEPPLTVAYKVLDVRVDARSARRRRGKDLHPNHAKRILAFFNNVGSAQEIVNKILDNPAYRLNTPRTYGIRLKLAEHILKVRASLPGRRFTSVSQIDGIRDVGDDTFEDIAYTFEETGTPTGIEDD